MSCPFFYPVARVDDESFTVPPRLPLGDSYQGECRAQGMPGTVTEHVRMHACNVGYGRGNCDRFPASAPVDAVRFHVTEAGTSLIRIQVVFEKQWWPAGDGTLEYSRGAERFTELHPDPAIQRQAEAYLESFLRRESVLTSSV